MNWTRKYVGKAFKDFGRGPQEYDCWGLVWDIYRKELGIDLPHYSVSPQASGIADTTIRDAVKSADWEESKEAQEFDIVIMALNWEKPEQNNHVGIYLGSGACIHCAQESGVAIVNLSAPLWNNRIRGFYKWQSS